MGHVLRFGRHELRPAQRELRADGVLVPLGARAFDVLVALAERRDRIVTKSELLELVWPGLIVEENNLQVQVGTLRKLLGAGAVATVPGRGYRFTLPAGEPCASTTPAGGTGALLPLDRTPSSRRLDESGS
jgi:DNA-binding winged helix-turn-helix (wHTH) protein